MGKRITIKDVANEAGVSVTTVSFVLNGKADGVPTATRERIVAVAKKLRYTPNYTARSLVTGRTKTIGIIVPSITNFFFAELVRLLQKKFAEYGYDILLSNNEERAENDLKYIEFLSGRNIDGLILTPGAQSLLPENTEKLKDALGKLTIPFLFLDRYIREYSHVSIDNHAGGYQTADYLLSRGHTKIGVVTGPRQLNSSYNRLEGFRRRLEEAGVCFAEKLIYEGQYDIETGEAAAEYFLKTDVTAIVAFSDMQAYGIYKKLKEEGKRVPEDLSIVGFDDNVYSSLLDKPLTTMRQPLEALACASVQAMLDRIQGKEFSPPEKVTATLIERESVKRL